MSNRCLNKQYLSTLIIVIASLVWFAGAAFAVGELLGLTIRVVLNDGQSFEGLVVEESETTVTLASENQEITVRRDEIQTMRLVQSSTAVRKNVSEPTIDDPLFEEARQSAIRRVATWQMFKDGIGLGGTLLSIHYAQARGNVDPLNMLIWYGGLAIGNFGVDLFLKPSVEERLFWRSQLPFWHGFNGFIGGLASLGGGISLAIGVTTSNVPMPELGPSDEWFERAVMAFVIQAGTQVINFAYDLISLLAPPSS